MNGGSSTTTTSGFPSSTTTTTAGGGTSQARTSGGDLDRSMEVVAKTPPDNVLDIEDEPMRLPSFFAANISRVSSVGHVTPAADMEDAVQLGSLFGGEGKVGLIELEERTISGSRPYLSRVPSAAQMAEPSASPTV
ncbi:unnamed protein product [Amoebophrya sp. A25]|nr:unnamed protein product [Amoebophrya sp. A25]|eukprot:GSA25T00026696001.1